jgi:hypothetical protein
MARHTAKASTSTSNASKSQHPGKAKHADMPDAKTAHAVPVNAPASGQLVVKVSAPRKEAHAQAPMQQPGHAKKEPVHGKGTKQRRSSKEIEGGEVDLLLADIVCKAAGVTTHSPAEVSHIF